MARHDRYCAGRGRCWRRKNQSRHVVSCHGEKGEGVAPNPKLSGEPEADLLGALKDYKSIAKANSIMNGLSATLSDQDWKTLPPTTPHSNDAAHQKERT